MISGHNFKICLELILFDNPSNRSFSEMEYYLVLQSVSRDYYLYEKSLYEHLDALDLQDKFETSDFYTPSIFKQVVPVYTNIQGGKGIFAGISRSEMKTTCNLVGYACE